MLELAEEIRVLQSYLRQFHPEPVETWGVWGEEGFLPRDSVKRFIRWLDANWDAEEQVGVLVVMRRARLSHLLFLHRDEPEVMEWWDRVREPLADALGGRTGTKHSGRPRSKFPKEDAL